MAGPAATRRTHPDDEPIQLALLAPARRCNQRCPRCAITEVFREPIRDAIFTPEDFVRFVSDFVDAGLPVQTASFQGYEVTLPESWPYLEHVFSFARRTGIRRTFVTNGMLLGRLAPRIDATDPNQISVSLDGGTPKVNDHARGLPGAFETTLRSLERFIQAAPRLRTRVAIASCVYNERTFRSLLHIPRRLRSLGISRWILSVPLSEEHGRVTPPPSEVAKPWLQTLASHAAAEGIRTHFLDLVGVVESTDALRVVRHGGLDNVYRLDPSGTIRTGPSLMRVYEREHAIQWHPDKGSAAVACGLRVRRAPRALAHRDTE